MISRALLPGEANFSALQRANFQDKTCSPERWSFPPSLFEAVSVGSKYECRRERKPSNHFLCKRREANNFHFSLSDSRGCLSFVNVKPSASCKKKVYACGWLGSQILGFLRVLMALRLLAHVQKRGKLNQITRTLAVIKTNIPLAPCQDKEKKWLLFCR